MRKLDVMDSLGDRIEALLESESLPHAALRWTVKSMDKLAAKLKGLGFSVSRRIVADYFHSQGYRLNNNPSLPGQRGPEDVNAQFRLITQVLRTQWNTRGCILFLEGVNTAFPNAHNFREKAFHDCPSEIRCVDEKFEQSIQEMRVPGGDFPLLIPATRERTMEEQKRIRQQKRDATTLPLATMTTERDPAIMTAIILRHWLDTADNVYSEKNKMLLILSSGTSPDTISPSTWRWEMNRLAAEMAMPISICRIPSSTWKFTGSLNKLFSFTGQDCQGLTSNGYTITAWLASNDNLPCNEIKRIPAIFDHRRYPKSRNVSERTLKSMRIQPGAQYSDWNYSFITNDC